MEASPPREALQSMRDRRLWILMKSLFLSLSRFELYVVLSAACLVLFWQMPHQYYMETKETISRYLRMNFTLIYFILIFLLQVLFVERALGGQLEYFQANGLEVRTYFTALYSVAILIVLPLLIPYWVLHHLDWNAVGLNLRLYPMIATDLIMILYFLNLMILFHTLVKNSVLFLSLSSVYIIYQFFGLDVPRLLSPIFILYFHEGILTRSVLGTYSGILGGLFALFFTGVLIWSRRSSLFS